MNIGMKIGLIMMGVSIALFVCVPLVIFFLGALSDAYREWKTFSVEGKFFSATIAFGLVGLLVLIISGAINGPVVLR